MIKVKNQKPAELTPVYKDSIKGDLDFREIMKEAVVRPLLVPVVASSPVEIKTNNSVLSEDDIANILLDCCGDTVNVQAEDTAKDLFGQTLIHFNAKTKLNIQRVFAIQSGTKENLPEPSDKVIYNPSLDVIPTSREFLAGVSSRDRFFATLTYYANPDMLGFYFANEKAFENFQTFLAQQMQMLGNILPANTNQMMADFQNLSLAGLTESIILRKSESENNEDYSFARVIIHFLKEYTNVVSDAEFGLLPFSLSEVICPKTVVFVNVERHSRASAKQVAEEWDIIRKSMQMKPNVVGNGKISKLTHIARNLQKARAIANSNLSNGPLVKHQKFKFRKTRPTTVDVTRTVTKLIEKMAFVSTSMNTYKMTKVSFAKPNRRDPDDFNKMGKVTSTRYKPDIHLYVDTSGSISERNYQDAIKACIHMAKKLNVNLYFNSFSHVLSQTTKLNTKDKTERQIYQEFQKVEKVSGGTNYENIWHFINCSVKRKREISLLITDFEYTAPNRFVKHPKNLYYLPCSHMDWDYMVECAEQFCKSMTGNDPAIRKHILF